MIIGNGAYPSPLNYHGFPKSICTSINNVACHGIPDNRPLQEGDILNVDITVGTFSFKTDYIFYITLLQKYTKIY